MENIIEGRVSKSKNRRSSILKSKRAPLEDKNPNLYEMDTETSFGKTARKASKRRVSFADKPQIKEFEKQHCSSETLMPLKEANIFSILGRNQEIYMQEAPHSDQILQLMQRDVRERIEEGMSQMQQKPQPQPQLSKRQSFDIHNNIDRSGSQQSMEGTDDDSICSVENKSFYCDTVYFDNGDDNMDLTCIENGKFDGEPSEPGAFSKSYHPTHNDSDKENIENANPLPSRIEDSIKGEGMSEKSAGDRETTLASDNWYQEMLEKASKTYDDKTCLSYLDSTDAEASLPKSQYSRTMLHDLMEEFSIKNPQINLEVKRGLPFESITRYLMSKDSQPMQSRVPEASDRHASSTLMSHQTFGTTGAVGESSETQVRTDLPFEPITRYLGPKDSQPMQSQMTEESDRHHSSALMSHQTFETIGTVGVRSELEMKTYLPFESISRYLGPKDSQPMQNQMTEESDQHPSSALLSNQTFETIGTVGVRSELEVKTDLPFESISRYLGPKDSQPMQSQMTEESDRHHSSALMSHQTFGTTGAVGESSETEAKTDLPFESISRHLGPKDSQPMQNQMTEESDRHPSSALLSNQTFETIGTVGVRSELEMKTDLPFESISRYLGPKDSQPMQSRMTEESDRHHSSALMSHQTFGTTGAVGESSETEAKTDLPFESISRHLGPKDSQPMQNQMTEESERNHSSALLSNQTFGTTRVAGERSAFYVPPRAKRAMFEADSRTGGSSNEHTLNKYTPSKQLSFPTLPSDVPSEGDNLIKKDEERGLQHSTVKGSALQNSDDDKETKQPQNYGGNVKILDVNLSKSDFPQLLTKQSANIQDAEFGADFKRAHGSSNYSKTIVECHDITLALLQDNVTCEHSATASSSHVDQRIIELHKRAAIESGAMRGMQEQDAESLGEQGIEVAAKASFRQDVRGMGDVKLPEIQEDRPVEGGVEEKKDNSVLSPELDFNRRRSETFCIPKKDNNAFQDDEDDAWLVKDVKEVDSMFRKRGETFVIPKMRYNANPKGEGLAQSNISIGDIKKNAKYRMSWVSRQELICASTPLRVSPVKRIDDISEVMEEPSDNLKVVTGEKTSNLIVTSEALSDDRMSMESCDEQGDAILSQKDNTGGISKHRLLEGKCELDLQKDEESLEETLQNETSCNEDDDMGALKQSANMEATMIPNVEVSDVRNIFPLTNDTEQESRVATTKRQNVGLEAQLAKLRDEVNYRLKEGATWTKILDDAMEARKEIIGICNNVKMRERMLNEKQSAPESCEIGDGNLKRGPETVTQSEDETVAKKLKLKEDHGLKKKEEEEKEAQIIIDHARKQLLPWFLSSWSRCHFTFTLFRFKLTIEFEELDENSSDFYNILKWESAITNITLISNSEGCDARSKYVTARMFRHIQSDLLIQKYKTTKCLKELLHEISTIIMAHKDLLEDLTEVYIKTGLTHLDDTTVESKFSSHPEYLFTRFSVRCKMIEGDAIPRIELSYHHLSGIDRTEMFRPILERVSDQGPMIFWRAVNQIKDLLREAPRTILF